MAGVAVFDLDRTLTARGSFMAFMVYVLRRRPARIVALPELLFAGLLLALKLRHRDAMKALLWRRILAGMDRPAVDALAGAFAAEWRRSALRPGALGAIQAHKAAGDRLILATAAMDSMAVPFGRALGFDDVVATRARWTPDGRVADAFDGLNCYGPEKLRRVLALLEGGLPPETRAVYTDHVTDMPLLAWATHPVAVNPHGPLRAAAEAQGIPVVDWDVAPGQGSG